MNTTSHLQNLQNQLAAIIPLGTLEIVQLPGADQLRLYQLNHDFPPFKAIEVSQSCTVADLDESLEFREVNLYLVRRTQSE